MRPNKPQVIQGSFVGRSPSFAVQTKPAFPNAVQPKMAPHVQAAIQKNSSPFQERQTAQPGGGQTPVMQRMGAGTATQVPPGQLTLRPGHLGKRLPEAVQRKMETALSVDFSDVRIHVGPEAASIGALAFTTGSNIYFTPGQYNPNTPHGQRLIGHELAHVVQQRSGRVRNPFGKGMAVVQDMGLEAEAERMGQRIMQQPGPRNTVQPQKTTSGTGNSWHVAQPVRYYSPRESVIQRVRVWLDNIPLTYDAYIDKQGLIKKVRGQVKEAKNNIITAAFKFEMEERWPFNHANFNQNVILALNRLVVEPYGSGQQAVFGAQETVRDAIGQSLPRYVFRNISTKDQQTLKSKKGISPRGGKANAREHVVGKKLSPFISVTAKPGGEIVNPHGQTFLSKKMIRIDLTYVNAQNILGVYTDRGVKRWLLTGYGNNTDKDNIIIKVKELELKTAHSGKLKRYNIKTKYGGKTLPDTLWQALLDVRRTVEILIEATVPQAGIKQ